ncbi:MAG TPA: spore coat U domain-containing protein [Rhizomicrobium sp.]|nr:spore coat U domain-containing protein [Rhizomicrobium sp.]
MPRFWNWVRKSLRSHFWLPAILLFSCLSSSPALAFDCVITPTTVAFGNVDVTTGTAVNSSGTLSISCTGPPGNGSVMRMCVDVDGGTAHDATNRQMTASANQLSFQLYSDSGRTTVWGSWPLSLYGGGYTWNVTVTANPATASIPIYGAVIANQQTVMAGSYSSTLTMFYTFDDHNTTACPEAGKGNHTTTFTATATVTTNCTVSATTLGFGSVGLLTSNVDVTNSVSVTCTNGTPYNIGLSAGSGTGATVANRLMTNSGTTVGYTIYSNSGRTTVWGNTVGTDTVSGTGTGTAQSITAYGRVPAQTTPKPQSYSDTLVATVTY